MTSKKISELPLGADADGTELVAVVQSTTTVRLTVAQFLNALWNTTASIISFLQSGSGAAKRSVQDKLRERYSLGDVGATTGTVVTAALATALTNSGFTDVFGSFGQIVHLQSGFWALDGTVSWPRRKDIQGEGIESTRLDGSSFASGSIGMPMLSMASHPDWRISRIRLEGGMKAAGIFFNGQCYYGVADQIHVNGFKSYGIWLNESAQSSFRSLSMYGSSANTDVAIVLDGGSQTTLFMGQLDTGCIGIQSATSATGTYHSLSANGSGFRSINSAFGAQYPAHKIGTGDALHDLVGGYYENTSNPSMPSDLFDVGSFAGGGGAVAPMINFARNIVAGSGVNPVVINNARQFNMWGNEIGPASFTVQASTVFFCAWGNNFPAGGVIVDQAQYSDVRQRNDYRISSPGGTRADSVDETGLGVYTRALTRALTAFVPKTVDALSFAWRPSGNASAQLALLSDGLHIPASSSAPTLANTGELSFQRVDDTHLKILMRGSDGTTRSVTLTIA